MNVHYAERDDRNTKTRVLDAMDRIPSRYKVWGRMTEKEKLSVWKERWDTLKDYVKNMEDK